MGAAGRGKKSALARQLERVTVSPQGARRNSSEGCATLINTPLQRRFSGVWKTLEEESEPFQRSSSSPHRRKPALLSLSVASKRQGGPVRITAGPD